MNDNIKIRKFILSESNPALKLSEAENLEFLRKSKLKIDLIEVEDIKNPSDLIVVITTEAISQSVVPVYFYKYRTQFIYQEGKFILDTQLLQDFIIEIGGNMMDIRIVAYEGVNKFKVTMYYRTYSLNEQIK